MEIWYPVSWIFFCCKSKYTGPCSVAVVVASNMVGDKKNYSAFSSKSLIISEDITRAMETEPTDLVLCSDITGRILHSFDLSAI